MNKKGTMSLATTVLVIATLILAIYAIVAFSSSKKGLVEVIGGYGYIDGLYNKELQLNFLVDKIAENAEKNSKTKEEFLQNMKIELNKYKSSAGVFYPVEDLKQVENQLVPENIVNKNGKVALKLNLLVKKTYSDKFVDLFDSSYSYEYLVSTNLEYK